MSFLYEKWFLKILVVINFLGTIWGFQWYQQQLAATPIKWWPLVPDSPLSSALFTIALVISLRGIKIRWLHLLACFVSIKYGIWAVAVITDYWLNGGAVRVTEIMLFLSHIGMAAEAIIYLPLAWPKQCSWVPFVIFTWVNDFADYYYAKHPYFFYEGQEPFGLKAALLLSGILSLAALAVSRWRWKQTEHE